MAIGALEGVQENEEGGALAFSSGSAVTASLLHLLPVGAHVISVNDVYGGTYRYFTKVAEVAQGLKCQFVDMQDV